MSKQSKHSSCSAAGERPRIGEPARELLVPARDERRAVGDALRGRVRLGRDLGVGHDARDEPLLLRLGRVEDPAFEQDLERDVGPDEAHERRHLGVGHHEPEVLDRRAEAARLAADAQVAQRGDLEPAADADAVDLRDQRMPARGERVAPSRASTRPYSIACALFARSVANSAMSLPGENAFSPAPRRIDAAQRVVGGQRVDRVAQRLPHRLASAR